MAEFMDFIFGVFFANEAHFGYENFGPKSILASIQPGRAGIARVGHQRGATFAGNLDP